MYKGTNRSITTIIVVVNVNRKANQLDAITTKVVFNLLFGVNIYKEAAATMNSGICAIYQRLAVPIRAPKKANINNTGVIRIAQIINKIYEMNPTWNDLNATKAKIKRAKR